jgi:hypothetical protein
VCFTLVAVVVAHTWTEINEALLMAEPEVVVMARPTMALNRCQVLLDKPTRGAVEAQGQVTLVQQVMQGALVALVLSSFVTLLTAPHLLLQQATLR